MEQISGLDSNVESFEEYLLFDSNASVKWLVYDNSLHHERYAGFYYTDSQPPDGSSRFMPFDDHLHVIEGEVSLTFLPGGPTLTVGPGQMGFIPAGSEVLISYGHLPFKEFFVMVTPCVLPGESLESNTN